MRIAVVGIGAVGGLVAARLWQDAADVTLVCAPAERAALRHGGLTIEHAEGRYQVSELPVFDPADPGAPFQAVLLCVSSPDSWAALRQVIPHLAIDPHVLVLQDGLDAAERVAALIGRRFTVPTIVDLYASACDEPGRIRHHGGDVAVRLAPFDQAIDWPLSVIAAHLTAAGLDGAMVSDAPAARWRRACLAIPFNLVGAALKRPLAALLADPAAADLLALAVHEVAAVARAACPDLDETLADEVMSQLFTAPGETRPPLLHARSKGHSGEIDTLVQPLRQRAEETGLALPVINACAQRLSEAPYHPEATGSTAIVA
ncbi:MAG: ketopantoate reductase family protein [Geminicoccaceae bacterium]